MIIIITIIVRIYIYIHKYINNWFPVESIYFGGGQHTPTPPHVVSGPKNETAARSVLCATWESGFPGIKSLQYVLEKKKHKMCLHTSM